MEDKQNEVLENREENKEIEETVTPEAEINSAEEVEVSADVASAEEEQDADKNSIDAPLAPESDDDIESDGEDLGEPEESEENVTEAAPIEMPTEECNADTSEEATVAEKAAEDDGLTVSAVPEAEDYLTEDKAPEARPYETSRERRKRNKKEWRELDRQHRKENKSQPKEKKHSKRTRFESGSLGACFGATIGFCAGLWFHAGVIGLVVGGAIGYVLGFLLHNR